MLHGLAEGQMVKLRAVAQFVIHRDQLGGMLIGFVFDRVGVDAWVAVMYSRRAARGRCCRGCARSSSRLHPAR